MAKEHVIRDPVYGYVDVPSELIGVIDHRMFQRLRRVSQTSLTAYVYPTATGNRFEHALGVMHLADRAWQVIWSHLGSNEESEAVRGAFIAAAHDDISTLPLEPGTFGRTMGLAFCAAAMLHDVGHPPFSHALEGVFRDEIWMLSDVSSEWPVKVGGEPISFHEYCGRRIAEDICGDVFVDMESATVKNGVPDAALQILNTSPKSRNWSGALHGLIAGEVDIDRIDYLIRDSHKAAGSEFGSIDFDRLLGALEIRFDQEDKTQNTFRIAPGVRARSAVETLLIQRLQAYEYIHFHPRVVGFNLALQRALESFLALTRLDEGEDWNSDSIKTLLRRLRPNLVYWDIDRLDVEAALGMWQRSGPASEGDQIELGEVYDSDQFVRAMKDRDEFRQIAAAGVDDGLLLETLKRAYLIASTAPPRYTSASTREEQQRFRIYSKAALFRRKNFVAAWKSIDEYVDVAAEMRTSLLDAACERLEERAGVSKFGDAPTLKGLADRIRFARDRHPSERIGAVIALNTLSDLLLGRPELVRRICKGLNERPVIGGQRGVWEVKYTGSGVMEQLKVDLYDARGESVSLIERSPLTEAVWFAEERRMKLAVYFFFADLDFSDPGAGSPSAYRGPIRDEVVNRLPRIVLEVIDEYV